jgi:hypothetical protein
VYDDLVIDKLDIGAHTEIKNLLHGIILGIKKGRERGELTPAPVTTEEDAACMINYVCHVGKCLFHREWPADGPDEVRINTPVGAFEDSDWTEQRSPEESSAYLRKLKELKEAKKEKSRARTSADSPTGSEKRGKAPARKRFRTVLDYAREFEEEIPQETTTRSDPKGQTEMEI